MEFILSVLGLFSDTLSAIMTIELFSFFLSVMVFFVVFGLIFLFCGKRRGRR